MSIGSDHNPIISKIKLKMKKLKRTSIETPIDINKLNDSNTKQCLTEIHKQLTKIEKKYIYCKVMK